jgi:hypothetical protein
MCVSNVELLQNTVCMLIFDEPHVFSVNVHVHVLILLKRTTDTERTYYVYPSHTEFFGSYESHIRTRTM